MASLPPRLGPITDILAATENAIRSACHEDELKALEAWLQSLLADVVARLAGDVSGELRPRLPSNGSIGCGNSPQHHDNSPDALEEWYTDPWASRKSNGSPALRAAQNLVEVFSLEQLDIDFPSEAPERSLSRETTPLCNSPKAEENGASKNGKKAPFGGTLAKEVEKDPRWQYGRCAMAKLVTYSPAGDESFERLLRVMMTVFDIPEVQQEKAFSARSQKLKSWWSFETPRCFTRPTA